MIKVTQVADDGTETASIEVDDFTIEVLYAGLAEMLREAAETPGSMTTTAVRPATRGAPTAPEDPHPYPHVIERDGVDGRQAVLASVRAVGALFDRRKSRNRRAASGKVTGRAVLSVGGVHRSWSAFALAVVRHRCACHGPRVVSPPARWSATHGAYALPGSVHTRTVVRLGRPIGTPPPTSAPARELRDPGHSGLGLTPGRAGDRLGLRGGARSISIAYAAPGFTLECPAASQGHQASTSCVSQNSPCDEQRIITIADPCPAAYMNEASNSWVLMGESNAPIDPYGQCP